jgi:hypothetical protein
LGCMIDALSIFCESVMTRTPIFAGSYVSSASPFLWCDMINPYGNVV